MITRISVITILITLIICSVIYTFKQFWHMHMINKAIEDMDRRHAEFLKSLEGDI